jgi:hypothetical protein
MAVVDWGVEEEPVAAAPVGSDWFQAPEAPMWAFLPAVWPIRHRCWIPVTGAPVAVEFEVSPDWNVESRRITPWTSDDIRSAEEDVNQLLLDAGVPARPPGRSWFLQVSAPIGNLDEFLLNAISAAETHNIAAACTREFVTHVSEYLRTRMNWMQ